MNQQSNRQTNDAKIRRANTNLNERSSYNGKKK